MKLFFFLFLIFNAHSVSVQNHFSEHIVALDEHVARELGAKLMHMNKVPSNFAAKGSIEHDEKDGFSSVRIFAGLFIEYDGLCLWPSTRYRFILEDAKIEGGRIIAPLENLKTTTSSARVGAVLLKDQKCREAVVSSGFSTNAKDIKELKNLILDLTLALDKHDKSDPEKQAFDQAYGINPMVNLTSLIKTMDANGKATVDALYVKGNAKPRIISVDQVKKTLRISIPVQ